MGAARGRNAAKDGLKVARLRRREPRRPPFTLRRNPLFPLFLIRRNLQSPGITKERFQERAVERRDLHAGYVVPRRLEDCAVAEPHRLVVDLVLRAEEQEVARLELPERDRNQPRFLKSLL